jgi:predicted Zn finger-like uncharacterized protein
MIITCPNCATRYQADASKFPAAGRRVKCAKCGHTWHQDPPPPEPASEAEEHILRPTAPPVAAEPSPAIAALEAPRVSAFRSEGQFDIPAHEPVVAPPDEQANLQPILAGRLGLVLGWALLAVVMIIAIWAFLRYRQEVATAWPQTASLYSALGRPVNPRGIDFKDVAYRRERQDGQAVLAITGKLVNTSSQEQPVAQIRAALSDDDGRELYHWTFSSGITTLRPGKSANFLTRISSPPPAARHLEVRFARDGE